LVGRQEGHPVFTGHKPDALPVAQQEGHSACKKLGVGLLVVTI